jgi:hypothetical protein
MNLRFILIGLALMTSMANAYGGSLKDGTWNSSACGVRPEPAQTNFSDTNAYNRSIEEVSGYLQNLSVYQNCLIKEANGDMQTIAQFATLAQQTAKATDDDYQAQLQAAAKRFSRAGNSVSLPFNRSNTETPCNCAR